MTSAPPAVPCDLCDGAEPALMSIMNLADYSQLKIGGACLPGFLEGLAAQIRGEPGADDQATPDLAPHTEHDVGPREDGGVPAPEPAPRQRRDGHGRYQPRS